MRQSLCLTILVLVGCMFPIAIQAQELDRKIEEAFGAGELQGLHGVIVNLGDQTLTERYFPGYDQRWGQRLGTIQHGPNTLHDLRSVTKSVVGLLYGIALDEGKVPAPDQRLYDYFPQYPDLRTQPGREKILISHVLSMQMGLEWNEDLPYWDRRNSEIAMEYAPDRYRFVLDRKIIEAPGKNWIYSGGAVALLAKLIEDGTGKPIDIYAREKLFEPLGITEFDWVKGQDGVPSAASGLRLNLPDLARIGRMVAQDGLYDKKQIVSKDWLRESFEPRARVDQGAHYGYLWYRAGRKPNHIVIAIGNGGQRLTVQPNHDLIIASFAGLYNDRAGMVLSLKMVREFAVPEAKRVLNKQD